MFKKLSEPTGAVSDNSPKEGDSDTQIVRPAILVHAGPNGEALTFQSGDGPIVFDADRIKKVVDIHNAYMDQLSQQYGDNIPMGAYEPILDSHDDGSNDKIIGRLTGRLKYEVRNVPKVGDNVPCAVADPGITFLGKDTVERVKDGRIYHLSIGISEETNRIGETSTVVKPAAPGAMLLREGSSKSKGGSMNVDVKRLKAHTEKLARLSAMKEVFRTSITKLNATQEQIKLTARSSEVTHRLRTAVKDRKMTPAEFREVAKNDGIKRLAALDDATLKIALMPFEARQAPVIHMGQLGSTSANDVADFGRDLKKLKSKEENVRLRSELNKDWMRLTGKRLFDVNSDDHKAPEDKEGKKEMSGPKEEQVTPGADEHVVPGQAGDEKQLAHHLAKLGHCLEMGDFEGAKKCHAAMCNMGGSKHMAEDTGDVKSEDVQNTSHELQSQVDEMKTQMSRLAGMVEEMMSAESEEGKHFGEMGDEHNQISKQA